MIDAISAMSESCKIIGLSEFLFSFSVSNYFLSSNGMFSNAFVTTHFSHISYNRHPLGKEFYLCLGDGLPGLLLISHVLEKSR